METTPLPRIVINDNERRTSGRRHVSRVFDYVVGSQRGSTDRVPGTYTVIGSYGGKEAAPITVVLAEYVPHRWWEWPLHNQTALRLKGTLFFRPNTCVVDVPYHLIR